MKVRGCGDEEEEEEDGKHFRTPMAGKFDAKEDLVMIDREVVLAGARRASLTAQILGPYM